MSKVDNPDTQADIELRGYLDDRSISGFTVISGAGSGKTTSLVKALAHVVRSRGDELRAGRRKIACITYTEVAVGEISREVANNPIVHVSTLHSFLWTLVRPFQRDIGRWARNRTQDKLTAARRAADIQRYTDRLERLQTVERFTYAKAGDLGRGVLGHEDVVSMVPELVLAKPLLARVLALSFPIVLVDESQDTFKSIVDCLKYVAAENPGQFCVGFFGDPMQKIYGRGVGTIEVPQSTRWKHINKPENFRSSDRVLATINAIRGSADPLVQRPGLDMPKQRPGEVTFVVLPADSDRTKSLEQTQQWLTANTAAVDLKILVIAHRMAAVQLGFANLHDAFHDEPKLRNAFSEGTAWPLRPFRTVILPACETAPRRRANLVALMRRHSPMLQRNDLTAANVRDRLSSLDLAIAEVADIVRAGGEGSLTRALEAAVAGGLFDPDPRLVGNHPILARLQRIDVQEVRRYFDYVEELSPYSTQQGVKGAEFAHVLTILDDDEGNHHQFSYDKYFGVKALSAVDLKRQADGSDSTVEWTGRLLYVCASRAMETLAILWYVKDVDAAVAALAKSGIAAHGRVLTYPVINGQEC